MQQRRTVIILWPNTGWWVSYHLQFLHKHPASSDKLGTVVELQPWWPLNKYLDPSYTWYLYGYINISSFYLHSTPYCDYPIYKLVRQGWQLVNKHGMSQVTGSNAMGGVPLTIKSLFVREYLWATANCSLKVNLVFQLAGWTLVLRMWSRSVKSPNFMSQ